VLFGCHVVAGIAVVEGLRAESRVTAFADLIADFGDGNLRI